MQFWHRFGVSIEYDALLRDTAKLLGGADIDSDFVDYLLLCFTSMGHRRVNEGLLKSASRNTRREFKREGKRQSGGRQSIPDIAEAMAMGNSGFFGIANQLFCLAPIYGEELLSYITPSGKANVSSFKSIVATCNMFWDPIRSREELYSRLRILFPGETPD